MAIKTICPYCGGSCKTVGGADGNPFNKNRKEKAVCTACGRTVAEGALPPLFGEEPRELLADTPAYPWKKR